MLFNDATINMAWKTSKEQVELIKRHIPRIEETAARYQLGTMARMQIDLELVFWKELLKFIESNLEGKVIQPS